jgi:hypothetical protein
MSLRRIKHTLLRMSAEEKVIGAGSLAIVVGTFLPWYTVVMSFDKNSLTETGFSGDLGVIGFVIFLMAIITGTVLVAENMRLPLPQFGYKREQILFFLLGESFFLTLLSMAIYTKRGLEFTDASLRFGIYTVLIASFFGALSAFALIQKDKKQEVEKFFKHEEIEESPKKTVSKHQEPEEPEAMFFEEGTEEIPDEQPIIDKNTKFTDYVPEDDMMEDVQEAAKSDSSKQGDFLKRDAGVSSNFYEDK